MTRSLNSPILFKNSGSNIELNKINVVNDSNSAIVNLENGIPNKSVCLTWTDVNATVPAKKSIFQKCKRNSLDLTTPKKLIYNVDGMACSKEILAIMGASGAGKTTLLNVLNFRNRGKLKIEGEIRVNGALVKSVEDISAVSGYVQQDDLFIGCLTVKEHLVFQVVIQFVRFFLLEWLFKCLK